MMNLLSSGLSYALLSADSSAKAALKPMNMVSRELKKQDPDLELVERAGKYGGKQLEEAQGSLEQAQEELKESQRMARQQEKQEMEARLKEKTAEKAAEKENEKITEGEKTGESVQISTENMVPAGIGASDVIEEDSFLEEIGNKELGVWIDVTA